MRIARLELHHVGVFEDETIEFHPKTDPDKAEIHILTGVNGSGKSTLLYALASAFGANYLSDSPIRRRLYNQLASEVQATLNNASFAPIIIKVGYVEQGKFEHVIDSEQVTRYRQAAHDDTESLVFMTGTEFSFAAFAYSGTRTLTNFHINSIKELTTNPLNDSLNFQSSVNPQIFIQWIANSKTKIALARQSHDIDSAERYENAIQRIEKVVELIVGYPVKFIFSYEPLAVQVKVKDRVLDFDVLPDGLKSIISWIGDLLMRLDRLKWVDNTPVLDRNFILFLDEIEIHLHPAWQRRILPVVQKLFKNAQIFIATHSPFVVASVSDAWIYKFVVKEGKSKLESVEESKAGVSYPAVLDEIFGIDEYFDVETEQHLDTFEKLKRKLLEGDKSVIPGLREVVDHLAQTDSVEVQDIIGRELRQIQRITGEIIEL